MQVATDFNTRVDSLYPVRMQLQLSLVLALKNDICALRDKDVKTRAELVGSLCRGNNDSHERILLHSDLTIVKNLCTGVLHTR